MEGLRFFLDAKALLVMISMSKKMSNVVQSAPSFLLWFQFPS